MVDIIVVRSNSIIYNPRVGKIAKSLDKKYSISVLGWNREGLSKEIVDSFLVNLRLLNIKAPFGRTHLLLYFPIYWFWVLFQLLIVYKPKAIHACDLDSAIPSYLYKLISRNKLVFDVCDRYAMGYIPQKFKILYSAVNSLEEFIGRKSDVLINVSGKLLSTFRRRPTRCAIIMNCSEDHASGGLSTVCGVDNREDSRASNNNEKLKLLYTGNIIRTRGLREISCAIKDLDRVQLDIAGRVVDRELFDEILGQSNIKYHGLLKPTDVWVLEASSHVIIALYDLKDPISIFSMGNKVFEALMNGVPVITNVSSDIVTEAECGIIVDYDNLDQIRNAIISLRDNVDLRMTLGKNGRMAFLQKYNWSNMEKELYRIYDNLLNKEKT